jgi:hypothetical protein
MLCTFEINGDGANWPRILEEAEETNTQLCANNGRDVPFEQYMSTSTVAELSLQHRRGGLPVLTALCLGLPQWSSTQNN